MSLNDFKKGWVVLTVPHAACPSSYSSHLHKCDVLAEDAANCIHDVSSEIKDNDILVIKPFVPDTPRTECDLNRYWCDQDEQTKSARNHPYRKKIRNFVMEHKDNIVFVLDVHSYPKNIGYLWKNYDLVLLIDNPASYANNFVEFMNTAKIPTLLQRGINNDLHVEMITELDKKSMLLEFNEKFIENRERLRFICRLIVIWLNKFSIV